MGAILGMVKGRQRHTFRCSFFSTTKVQSALVLATRGSVLLCGRTQCVSNVRVHVHVHTCTHVCICMCIHMDMDMDMDKDMVPVT